MIKEVDSNNSGEVDFDEFVDLYQKVQNGEVPSTTGLAKLIKAIWEEHIANMNKPTPKNTASVQEEKRTVVVEKAKPSEFNQAAPEGQKWKLNPPVRDVAVEWHSANLFDQTQKKKEVVEKKKVTYNPATLPQKKSFADLP